MNAPKIVVHTDVVADHLLHRGRSASTLRLAMQKFFCYTTVFNAIELFSIARTTRERRAVEQALSAMKILGLNARSAPRHGALVGLGLGLQRMNALVAGMCLEIRLPILTGQPKEFSGVKGLVVIPARAVLQGRSAEEILRLGGRKRV
jgi:predicted nucleic acid-binding protein